MPTHVTNCVVCEENCYCHNDTLALGCGGRSGEGGCENPPHIEFCSLECALELQRRLAASIANYHDVKAEAARDAYGDLADCPACAWRIRKGFAVAEVVRRHADERHCAA